MTGFLIGQPHDVPYMWPCPNHSNLLSLYKKAGQLVHLDVGLMDGLESALCFVLVCEYGMERGITMGW